MKRKEQKTKIFRMDAPKKAFITGITGQDGAYLAEFLLKKGYIVHGLLRRCSTENTGRLTKLLDKITFHYGDLTDSSALFQLIFKIDPDEVYNLAAQSDVAVSFANPEYTANVNALGTLRLLEAIKTFKPAARFYQASTSELFGKVQETPQKETTPFYPRSPYGVSKLFSYWITVNYREAYNLFACNGILFNHESPLRGTSFVTRKITRSLGRIFWGTQKCLYLGNLNAKRDWGHARESVEMQWQILQQNEPDDYVIASGETHSIREFATIAAAAIGITLTWEGKALDEKGIVAKISSDFEHSLKPGQAIIKIDPKFFRPAEVETLLGDYTKAYKKFGWKPKIPFNKLVEEMAQEDFLLAKKEARDCGAKDADAKSFEKASLSGC